MRKPPKKSQFKNPQIASRDLGPCASLASLTISYAAWAATQGRAPGSGVLYSRDFSRFSRPIRSPIAPIWFIHKTLFNFHLNGLNDHHNYMWKPLKSWVLQWCTRTFDTMGPSFRIVGYLLSTPSRKSIMRHFLREKLVLLKFGGFTIDPFSWEEDTGTEGYEGTIEDEEVIADLVY